MENMNIGEGVQQDDLKKENNNPNDYCFSGGIFNEQK